LADIARQPQAFSHRTVLSRGWVIDSGTVPEGTWVQLAVSGDALARARGNPAAAADAVIVLFAAGGAEQLDDLRGKELEMMLRIEEPVVLGDGRAAVRALPLQLAATTRFASEAAREPPPEALVYAPGPVSGGFFRDPQVPASRSTEPVVKFTFLEPDLRRPFWYVPGPVTIEKTGTEEPEYRFTSVTKSEDGDARESTCRFRVERGNLRSVAYDEVRRDPGGKPLEEEHLDFLSGTVMDKVTGARAPWPENIYAGPCLGLALHGYPFHEQRVLNFFLWSEYEPTAAMSLVLDGTEPVTVPAGTFDCYRIRMNVDTERMLRRLVLPSEQGYQMARDIADQMRPADTVLWLTTDWPHTVVKVEGSMGPPGTSRSVMELLELDADARAGLGTSGALPASAP